MKPDKEKNRRLLTFLKSQITNLAQLRDLDVPLDRPVLHVEKVLFVQGSKGFRSDLGIEAQGQ